MFERFTRPKTTYISISADENNKVKASRPQLIDNSKIIDVAATPEERKSFFEDLKPKKTTEIFKVKIRGEDDIEKSEYVFRKIYLFDDLKFNIYRGLTSTEAYNLMLIGKAGTAKSLFMMEVLNHFNNVLYINTKSSSAGIIEQLRDHPNTKILIIEEMDRMNSNDINDLRSLISDGKINKSLKSETINLSFEGLKILITTNGIVKLDAPILSRFIEYYIPEYTDEEFKEVCAFCLPDFRAEITHSLAEVLMANNMKDVRDCILLSRMLRPNDSDRIIEKIVTSHIRLSTTKTKGVDWNKKH